MVLPNGFIKIEWFHQKLLRNSGKGSICLVSGSNKMFTVFFNFWPLLDYPTFSAMAWAPDSLRLWQRLINLCRSLSLRFARDFELLFTCNVFWGGIWPEFNEGSDQNMWSEVSGWTCEAKLAGVHVIDFFCDLNLWMYMWLDILSDTSFISSISFFAWHSSSSSLPWASLLIRFIRLKFCNCDVSPSQSWAWQTSPPSCDIGFVTSSSQRPPRPLFSSNCFAPEPKLWSSSTE